MAEPERSDRRGERGQRALAGLGALVAVALVVFIWGGYGAGWAWTGLSSDVTLWDWLEALALPVTVALVPLVLQRRRRLHRPHKVAGALLAAGFGLLVLLGYLVPWDWTGFRGNTLWDWWQLALLPLVVATVALWPRPEEWTGLHFSIVGAVLATAAVISVAGYLVPWAWTGVQGNTAWDWIKLLLLPVLLPTLVLPRLIRAADEWTAGESARVRAR
jgi:hypothetical protein